MFFQWIHFIWPMACLHLINNTTGSFEFEKRNEFWSRDKLLAQERGQHSCVCQREQRCEAGLPGGQGHGLPVSFRMCGKGVKQLCGGRSILRGRPLSLWWRRSGFSILRGSGHYTGGWCYGGNMAAGRVSLRMTSWAWAGRHSTTESLTQHTHPVLAYLPSCAAFCLGMEGEGLPSTSCYKSCFGGLTRSKLKRKTGWRPKVFRAVSCNFVCIRDFSVAVVKHYDRGNL